MKMNTHSNANSNSNSDPASLLGRHTPSPEHYSPDILFTLPRQKPTHTPPHTSTHTPSHAITGHDEWTCYEVSWLTAHHRPENRVLVITIPADSPQIVESKSLKLYLNSFNNTVFDSDNAVLNTIKKDLEDRLHVSLQVKWVSQPISIQTYYPNMECLDHLIPQAIQETPSKNQLTTTNTFTNTTVYTALFRSNCPVTHQPDWAWVAIHYKGQLLTPESLLGYLLSFRSHAGFHEDCVEKILSDIVAAASASTCTVHARFTRRGGIDINPIRSTDRHYQDLLEKTPNQ